MVGIKGGWVGSGTIVGMNICVGGRGGGGARVGGIISTMVADGNAVGGHAVSVGGSAVAV